MAVELDDPQEGERPRRRASSQLAHADTLPSVDYALEDFISRANEQRIDLAPFDSDKREDALRRELEATKRKLASIEARARPSWTRWLVMGASFMVGAVAMAAVSYGVREDKPVTAVAPAPTPVVAPTVTPIATPTVTPIPEPVVQAPPPPPVEIAKPEPAPEPKPKPVHHATHSQRHAAAKPDEARATPSENEAKAKPTDGQTEDGLADPFEQK